VSQGGRDSEKEGNFPTERFRTKFGVARPLDHFPPSSHIMSKPLRVLVLGGTGEFGSRICRRVSALNHPWSSIAPFLPPHAKTNFLGFLRGAAPNSPTLPSSSRVPDFQQFPSTDDTSRQRIQVLVASRSTSKVRGSIPVFLPLSVNLS
jgi:hypothetical protein